MNAEYCKLLKSVAAILPGYKANYGKVTRIYLKDGRVEEVDFSLSKVLRDCCLIHCLSLSEIKKLSGNITESKGMVPIYIGEDRILMPFKVYEKKGDNERSFGYINMKEIEDIGLNNKYIILKNGIKIKYFDKNHVVMKKIGQGRLLLGATQVTFHI